VRFEIFEVHRYELLAFAWLRHGQKRGEHPSAVRASRPTARPAHTSAQLIDADLDAAFPSLCFLGRRDPTDPFVSRQWGDIGPEALRSGIGFYGFPDICWQFVHRAARDPLSSHTLNRPCFAQRDRDKPRQGVVADTLKLHRNGAVGFIDWLGEITPQQVKADHDHQETEYP